MVCINQITFVDLRCNGQNLKVTIIWLVVETHNYSNIDYDNNNNNRTSELIYVYRSRVQVLSDDS